jgi:hypothetical protein
MRGPDALKRTRKMRSRKTGTPMVRKVLGLVAFRREVMRGLDRAAGRIPRFEDLWAPRRSDRGKAPWS